jgi:hypothetical protein
VSHPAFDGDVDIFHDTIEDDFIEEFDDEDPIEQFDVLLDDPRNWGDDAVCVDAVPGADAVLDDAVPSADAELDEAVPCEDVELDEAVPCEDVMVDDAVPCEDAEFLDDPLMYEDYCTELPDDDPDEVVAAVDDEEGVADDDEEGAADDACDGIGGDRGLDALADTVHAHGAHELWKELAPYNPQGEKDTDDSMTVFRDSMFDEFCSGLGLDPLAGKDLHRAIDDAELPSLEEPIFASQVGCRLAENPTGLIPHPRGGKRKPVAGTNTQLGRFVPALVTPAAA